MPNQSELQSRVLRIYPARNTFQIHDEASETRPKQVDGNTLLSLLLQPNDSAMVKKVGQIIVYLYLDEKACRQAVTSGLEGETNQANQVVPVEVLKKSGNRFDFFVPNLAPNPDARQFSAASNDAIEYNLPAVTLSTLYRVIVKTSVLLNPQIPATKLIYNLPEKDPTPKAS